jgi:transcriptional regulator with XRE-family HTH domain
MHERLKLLRTTLGLTQKDFAEKIDIDQRNYTNYENGNAEMKAKHIQKLIENYEINANWLLTGEGEMFANNAVNYSSRLSEAIEDALSEIEEPELTEFIKEKTVAKIVEKLSIPTSLLSKAFNFLIYERPLVYLYLIFRSIKPYDGSTSHKEWIIKSISETSPVNSRNIFDPAFNIYSKNHMIKRLEELTEDECRVLLESIPQLQKHLEKNISISNIVKKRFGF